MNRRDSLKALAVGTVTAGTLLSSCNNKDEKKAASAGEVGEYGRTPEEKLLDKKLMEEKFFTTAELATITLL